MIIKYQSWLENYCELNTEIGTQTRLDASNKTKNKPHVESGKYTAKDIAQRNHTDKLHYEFCVFDDSNDNFPFCYVTVVPRNKHVGVNFIDDAGRNYLTYLFHEINEDRKLFLSEAWYHRFLSETGDDEKYRLHFVFDENGNVDCRKYDEVAQKAVDYESSRSIDTSKLYENYPDFGQYESLTKIDRDLSLRLD